MLSKRIITVSGALLFASSALASQPLPAQLGVELSFALGGMAMIAAVSLALGISLVKQKQRK